MRTINRQSVHTRDELQRLFGVRDVPKDDMSVIIHRDETQTIKIMLCMRMNHKTRRYSRIKNSYGTLLYDAWFYTEETNTK